MRIPEKSNEKRIEKEIDKLLKKLTLEEKIAMVHGAELFRSGKAERLGIPALVTSDGPMGVRAEFLPDRWLPAGHNDDQVSYLPCNSALASTWNRTLAVDMGHVLGEEARGRGKDIILAPGINIKRDPRCGRNFEYMSEDPKLTAEIAVPFIQGIQENDVAACVKHFAANGQETDRLMVDEEIDDRTLYEIYLPAFKAAVQEAKVYAVMGAYNRINGVHCSESRNLLDLILRGEWGFDGAVLSDWGSVHHTKEAAECSLDLEMSVFPDFDEYKLAKPFQEMIEKGELSEECLNKKVRNLLRLMFRLKMLGNSKEERKKGAYNTPEHREIALRGAEESMILLKNEGELLPLQEKKIKKLVVIGQNAAAIHSAGGGSAEIRALYEICPLMGIKSYLGGNTEVVYVPGYYVPKREKPFEESWQATSVDGVKDSSAGRAVRDEENDAERFRREDEERLAKLRREAEEVHQKNEAYFAEAVEAAKDADAVLFVGGMNHEAECEGFDRADMKLPYEQDLLIERLLKVREDLIIALIGGSPVEMPWRDKGKAILWSYYAGMETGSAFAKLLFGAISPSGKLAETFPAKYEDTATGRNGQFGQWGKIRMEEGLYFGYRHHDRAHIAPAFCFGHGLSYTSFEYSALKLQPDKNRNVKLTFTVKNTGKMAGAEIVQVYVAPISHQEDRPDKELKGFEKVFLASGKAQKVTITLQQRDFAYFDVHIHDFVVDKGDYEILVGASSGDIRLKGIAALE